MSSSRETVQMNSHGINVDKFYEKKNKTEILDRLQTDNQQQTSVEQQINSLKKQLEIELKVKAGAESILNTYTGQRKENYRKMCDEAQVVLKDAKAKAEFLLMQITQLENSKKEFCAFCFFFFKHLGSNDPSSSTQSPTITNEQNPIQQRIHALNKQLEIESKVKAGTETLLLTYAGQRKESSRKICDEAQILLKDAKAKVEYIRLEIKRLETELLMPKDQNKSNESHHLNHQSLWPSEQTIQQLEHHLTIETTMKKGGENAVKVLKQTGAKKEVLAEAHQSLFESKQRIALLEEALKRRYKNCSSSNNSNHQSCNNTLLKPAAITGKLQVRLVQNLSFVIWIISIFKTSWLSRSIRRCSSTSGY